jgi:hypothetical protein
LEKNLVACQKRITELETENAQCINSLEFYKGMYENNQRVKEEKRSLERQVQVLDQMRQRLAQSELDLDSLKLEKQEWKSFLKDRMDFDEIDSPFAMAQLVSKQQTEICELTDRLGQVDIELKLSQTKLQKITSQVCIT